MEHVGHEGGTGGVESTYLRLRKARLKRLESEDQPLWLKTYEREIKSKQQSKAFRAYLDDLKPWEKPEAYEATSSDETTPDGDDERFHGTRKNRFINKLAAWLRRRVVSRLWFDLLVFSAIIAVAGVTGHELETERETQTEFFIDLIALVIFAFEFVCKVLMEGDRPLQYLLNPKTGALNAFDGFLVVVSVTDMVVSTSEGELHEYAVLRILRLLRLLSLVNKQQQLRLIIVGIAEGLKNSVYIILLLLLVVYMAGVLSVRLFAVNDPGNFGSLPVAMITLFQVSTVTTWSPLAYTAIYGCDKYSGAGYNGTTDELGYKRTLTGKIPNFDCHSPDRTPVVTEFFFMLFTILTAFILMSLFVGAITMAMFDTFQVRSKSIST